MPYKQWIHRGDFTYSGIPFFVTVITELLTCMDKQNINTYPIGQKKICVVHQDKVPYIGSPSCGICSFMYLRYHNSIFHTRGIPEFVRKYPHI